MNPRVNMASYRPAVTAESGGPSGSHGEFHLQGNLLKTSLSNKKKKNPRIILRPSCTNSRITKSHALLDFQFFEKFPTTRKTFQ